MDIPCSCCRDLTGKQRNPRRRMWPILGVPRWLVEAAVHRKSAAGHTHNRGRDTTTGARPGARRSPQPESSSVRLRHSRDQWLTSVSCAMRRPWRSSTTARTGRCRGEQTGSSWSRGAFASWSFIWTNTRSPTPVASPRSACTSTAPPSGSRGIDEILAAARTRLHRIQPVHAHEAQRTGAVLVDIHPAAQREATREIPGALVIGRNVLEWHFDLRSEERPAIEDRYDLPVIIVCQQGHTSSLAAVALHDLGLHQATDMIGEITARSADGLPVTPTRHRARPHPAETAKR